MEQEAKRYALKKLEKGQVTLYDFHEEKISRPTNWKYLMRLNKKGIFNETK